MRKISPHLSDFRCFVQPLTDRHDWDCCRLLVTVGRFIGVHVIVGRFLYSRTWDCRTVPITVLWILEHFFEDGFYSRTRDCRTVPILIFKTVGRFLFSYLRFLNNSCRSSYSRTCNFRTILAGRFLSHTWDCRTVPIHVLGSFELYLPDGSYTRTRDCRAVAILVPVTLELIVLSYLWSSDGSYFVHVQLSDGSFGVNEIVALFFV